MKNLVASWDPTFDSSGGLVNNAAEMCTVLAESLLQIQSHKTFLEPEDIEYVEAGSVNNNIDPDTNGLVKENQQMSDRAVTARANREERLRLLKDKQNEERLRKLEELKEHAIQAAKLREEQDLRRRRHFEELGKKDEERRRQAEEKRRLLDEERRNNFQTKWETKEKLLQAARQNEKKPVYAFGSCTPRIIENVDGCLWKSQYNLNLPRETALKSTSAHDLHSQSKMSSSMSNWNQQRTTFDIAGTGSASRGSRDKFELKFRNTENDSERIFCGRRKTDLTPTLPIRRDNFGSRSASRADSGTGSRSGNATPSRPPSSMTSSLMTSSTHSQVQMRPRYLAPRRLRPASVHVTGVSIENQNHNHSPRSGDSTPSTEKSQKPKVDKSTIKIDRPSKTPSPRGEGLSKASRSSSSASDRKPESDVKARTGVPKKPAEKLVSEKSPGDTSTVRRVKSKTKESEHIKASNFGNQVETALIVSNEKVAEPETTIAEKVESFNEALIDHIADLSGEGQIQLDEPIERNSGENPFEQTNKGLDLLLDQNVSLQNNTVEWLSTATENVSQSQQESVIGANINENEESSDSKVKILTEEAAKAAIAEKRRLAREAQEKEMLRLEEEQRLEEEKQRLEAEEAERFAQEARRLEEERLQKAIEEKERREEEERRKKEEEEKARLEREREDREAAREAERVRLEMEERLKREEEERLERKRRVEAIMSRTRKKDADAVNEKSAIVQDESANDVKSSINGINHQTTVESNQSNIASNVDLNNFNNNVDFSDTLIDFGDIIQNSSGNPNSTHSNNAGNNIMSNPLQDLLS